jgi:hypothetical protein
VTSLRSLRRLVLGLATCAAWGLSGAPLRADAEGDSPFTFTPPAGWRRAPGPEGMVYYTDPEAAADCRIYVSPPRTVPVDDFRRMYDELFRERLGALGNMGYVYENHHEPSSEQSDDGLYQIYDQVVVENDAGDALYYQAKFVSKGDHAQMLEWVGDLKRCAFGSIQAKLSFDTIRLKATNDPSTEKRLEG